MIPMIQFLAPSNLLFLLLIPLLVAIYYGFIVWRKRQAQVSGPSDLRFLLAKDRPWLRHIAVGLAVLSLAALTVALARPNQPVSVPRDRATILMVVDVSKSMEATDVSPNRMEAAKAAAVSFVRSLPRRFNVALISFAGTADVDVQPTTDHDLVVSAIQALTMRSSTAMGDAIFTALGALVSLPPDPDDPNAKIPAAMVLMSDGQTIAGRSSRDAADAAKKLDVPIFAIAYGTPSGYIVQEDGRRTSVPVDYREIAEISRRSSGKAYRAESAGELQEVYATISSSVGYQQIDQETTAMYATGSLVFAIFAALGMASLAARWP